MFQKQLITKTALLYFFAVLGGYCVDFCIYLSLIELGLSVYLSNVAGFCAGAIINVIFIRKFVFSNNRFCFWADLQFSLISNALMFAFGMVALYVLIEFYGVNPYAAKIISSGATFVANYAIRVVLF